ncbi:MAG: tRNA glutamyl-Q synthetase [Deltaproteobacteria bacterium]|nr:tRNA glutamyl-Q synthetase [Deltaproteobacteria bacterium]|tara:strand:+ start:92 stop:1021 length:930 start_codon:yes stop_codon:yes gene_type:complete
MSSKLISRLAPTPSGNLHFGNAFNFLLTYLLVKFHDGILHLRIDDLDGPRVDPKSVEDIFIQLEWLGIEYHYGPSGPDELYSNYSQQLRKDRYFNAIEILKKSGNLFACECSRSKIRNSSTSKIYPGTCRNKNIKFLKDSQAWRVIVPENTFIYYNTFINNRKQIDLKTIVGDFVIRRRDGQPAYQIASLIDDIEMSINLIVRGNDLIPSTGAQIFLAEYLKDSVFSNAHFVHHKLIKNESGNKLSKSFRDHSLKLLRNKNSSPTIVYQQSAKILDLPFEEIQTLQDLIEAFRSEMNRRNLLMKFDYQI